MIIWIILQDEISVQVSADGTRLSGSEYKKPPEIDFSLWLQFLFVFSTVFSVRESFRSRRFWDLWWRSCRHQSFFSPNLPLKELHGTQPQLSWSLCGDTVKRFRLALKVQTAQTKMDS